jgi:hypothetical protein
MRVKIISAVCSAAVVLCAFAAAFALPRMAGTGAQAGKGTQAPSSSAGSSPASSGAASNGAAASGEAGAQEEPSYPAPQSATPAQAGAGYTVKTYGGGIGVFAAGAETPERFIDVDPSALPAEEREKLNRGIAAATLDDALRILENCTS